MRTKIMVMLGVSAGLFVLVSAVGLLVGLYYFVDHKMHEPVRRARMDKAWDDGEIFGKQTDQDGCMAKILSFTDTTDTYDLSNYDFGHACFTACRPTAGFCDGVKVGFGGHWDEEQCPDGINNRDACVSAYENKLSTCRTEKFF